MADGFVSVAVGAMPSFTNPNNISVITGVSPSVHGISGNFFLNPVTGQEQMMNDPEFLRADSILAKFSEHGAKVVAITAKDKLARMLAYHLQHGISFSAEKADKCTKKDNGIDNCLAYAGKPLPSDTPPIFPCSFSKRASGSWKGKSRTSCIFRFPTTFNTSTPPAQTKQRILRRNR